jgi:prepilin-type N-terminal cleavage/methylation domain-containing protein
MLRLGDRRKEAFSLIELLLVTTLLGVLAALILPSGTKISDTWTRHRERLQMAEEKERFFQKLQEDWIRAVCHRDREEDDIQIVEDGAGIILSCRRDDGSHEYILWHWDGVPSGVGDKIYRSRLQEYSEPSKALCDQQNFNEVPYRSFRKMFPEYIAAENVLSKDLFTHQIVWWRVQYVGERELTTEHEDGDASSDTNTLIYEDFPEFFSWRAWAHGDLSLEREPQWLAVTIAILPSLLRPQWEALSSEDQKKSFLHQHGIFRTKLLPFRDCNGA